MARQSPRKTLNHRNRFFEARAGYYIDFLMRSKTYQFWPKAVGPDHESRTFMKYPLILSADDGVHIFDSETGLLGYVEPIDVAHNEYVVYDSEGRVLPISVEKPSGIFSVLRNSAVVLRESEVFKTEELRCLLIDHLGRLGKRVRDDTGLELTQLIQRVIATK